MGLRNLSFQKIKTLMFLLFVLFFQFLLLSFFSINGNAITSSINISCVWLDKSVHYLHSYDIHSNLIINAYNGITCCDEKQGIFQVLKDNKVVFQKNFSFNDFGKGCDEKEEDGVYCANLDIDSFELEKLFEKNDSLSVKLIIVYSKIANYTEELNLTNAGFDNFSIICKNYNHSHVQCFFSSKNKVWVENQQKDCLILRQGVEQTLSFYLQNNFCGFKKVKHEIKVPDFVPPEKPVLSCRALANGKMVLKWENIRDNVEVKKIELFKYVKKMHLNLSDYQKKSLGDEFGFKDLESENLSLADFKLVSEISPNQDMYYDQCPDCEIYYFIKVFDEYGHSNVSDICKTFSDTTKPKNLIFVQIQNSNDDLNKTLFFVGDAKYIKLDKTFYSLTQYLNSSLKYVSLKLDNALKSSFKLSIFDSFGNEVDYAINLPERFLIKFDQDKNHIFSESLFLTLSNQKPKEFISQNFNALPKTNQLLCSDSEYLYAFQESEVHNSLLFFGTLQNPCKSKIDALPILNKDFINENNYTITGNYDVLYVNESTFYVLKNVSIEKATSFEHANVIAKKIFVLDDDVLNALNSVNLNSSSFSNISEFVNVLNSSLNAIDYLLSKRDNGYKFEKRNSNPLLFFITGAFTKLKKSLPDEILNGFSFVVGFIALGVIVLLMFVYLLYKVGHYQITKIKIKDKEENAGLGFEHIKKIEERLMEKEEKKKRLQKLIEKAKKSEEEIMLKKKLEK